jgi:hypothetical protein
MKNKKASKVKRFTVEETEKLPKPSELWIKYWNECLVEEIKKINKQKNKGE